MSVDRPVHCTDAELLAYLDGELSWWRRFRVQRHLQACWRCRSRARSQEEQIHQLTERMEAWEYPDALWHLDRQLELGLRLRRFENAGQVARPRAAATRRLTLAIGVALAMCAALAVLPRNARRSDSDVPVQTVAGAQTFERKLYQLPVEQTLAVRIEPIRPARQAAAGQLEIWSDAAQGRYASRWTAADGTLKLALWRPAPGREYLLRPRVSHAVLERTGHSASDRITDFLGADMSGDLEEAFIGWMESRSWAPVSFAPEAAQWMSGEGARAVAESITAGDGTRRIRITVERRMQAASARLTAEFDAVSFQPRSMSIRFEAEGRAAEVDLIAQRTRSVASAEVAAAAVAPESAEFSAVRPAGAPQRPDRQPVFSVDPALIDSAERAAEAQFVLHAAEACLGEAVVVEEVPEGVRVRGIQGTAGRWPEATSSFAKLADVLGALAELRERVAGAREPENPAIPRKAVAHARALRALGRQFPPRLTAALPERSRHLLQLMLQNHIEGVRAGFADLSLRIDGEAPVQRIGWREAAERLYETLADAGEEAGAALPKGVGQLLQALSEGFAADSR